MNDETNGLNYQRRKLLLAGVGASMLGGCGFAELTWCGGGGCPVYTPKLTPEEVMAKEKARQERKLARENYLETVKSMPIRYEDEIVGVGVLDKTAKWTFDMQYSVALLGKKNTYLVASIYDSDSYFIHRLIKGLEQWPDEIFARGANFWGFRYLVGPEVREDYRGIVLPAADLGKFGQEGIVRKIPLVLRDPPPKSEILTFPKLFKPLPKRLAGKLIPILNGEDIYDTIDGMRYPPANSLPLFEVSVFG